jgi:diacylglycerol O-acyltransferase
MDLAAAKAVAHTQGGKVNDVVLTLAAGGIRGLLQGRSERVDGVRMHVSVAVSLRPAKAKDDIGNRSGGIALRVPLGADPHKRLRAIARESTEAKADQQPTVGNSLLVWLARIGVLRYFSRHQRTINFVESNVAGPPARISLLGAPVQDIVPIGTLVGNFTIGFLALSYAGRLTVAVQADADRYPDLPVLIAAMERDCSRLLAAAPNVDQAAEKPSG